jgi:M6 family metalloprotease-like protein
MKMKKILFLILLFIPIRSFSVYVKNYPITLTQPNGSIINCYITGDEFYRRIFDSNDYTIVCNTNGYFVYATIVNGLLVPTNNIVGISDPSSLGLMSGLKENYTVINSITQTKRDLLRVPVMQNNSTMLKSAEESTLNNLCVYIRFSDDSEFGDNQSYYTTLFNDASSGKNSLLNYFREVSYGQLTINSTFYPTSNTTVVSYKDAQKRGYYRKYSSSNTIGYSNDTERRTREHTLLRDAINFVTSQIPSTLDIDYNNDGFVDNLCFIVRGNSDGWADLLWPHQWALYSFTVNINGIRVMDYDFQLQGFIKSSGVGVLCHEMYHSIGAPDLYHYEEDQEFLTPVGSWDIMEQNQNPPQSMGAFMKFKYGGWITNIPEITTTGHYTLNSISSSTNNCYMIKSPKSTEYFVLEYRRKEGTFESSIPGSGLLIYRINTKYTGNADGPPDGVYIYRPEGTLTENGDIDIANYTGEYIRSFSNVTEPNCFLSDGSLGNVYISNILANGSTISFDVKIRTCTGSDIVFSNTSSLPTLSNASNSIKTSGNVTVKSTDKISFEAKNQVILNGGFTVQQGGTLTIDMCTCK